MDLKMMTWIKIDLNVSNHDDVAQFNYLLLEVKKRRVYEKLINN